jgi:transposase
VRVVGLDIHRVFAEAVMLDEGKIVRLGRVGMTREHLEAFARDLTHDDHVVVEATGNAAAVAEVVSPHVGRVVIANPRQVRLIAHAKIKTDKIDATVLAKLYASNFLPEVWVPDARTLALRRQVTRRNQIVRQRVRLRTTAQSASAGAPGSWPSNCRPTSRTPWSGTCASTTGSATTCGSWSASWRATPWRLPTSSA